MFSIGIKVFIDHYKFNFFTYIVLTVLNLKEIIHEPIG